MRQQLGAQLVVLRVHVGAERPKPLAHGLARGRELLGLRQLQHEHRIARLLEVLRQRAAQALGRFRLGRAQAIGEIVEAVIDVLYRRRAHLLQAALNLLRQLRLTLQHDADAIADPQHGNQCEDGEEHGG